MSDELASEVRPSVEGEQQGRDYREIHSKYECVIAAAREAERLNEFYRNRGINPDEKVTVEAIRRVREERSRITYEEAPAQEEEPRKETTYFFGS